MHRKALRSPRAARNPPRRATRTPRARREVPAPTGVVQTAYGQVAVAPAETRNPAYNPHFEADQDYADVSESIPSPAAAAMVAEPVYLQSSSEQVQIYDDAKTNANGALVKSTTMYQNVPESAGAAQESGTAYDTLQEGYQYADLTQGNAQYGTGQQSRRKQQSVYNGFEDDDSSNEDLDV